MAGSEGSADKSAVQTHLDELVNGLRARAREVEQSAVQVNSARLELVEAVAQASGSFASKCFVFRRNKRRTNTILNALHNPLAKADSNRERLVALCQAFTSDLAVVSKSLAQMLDLAMLQSADAPAQTQAKSPLQRRRNEAEDEWEDFDTVGQQQEEQERQAQQQESWRSDVELLLRQSFSAISPEGVQPPPTPGTRTAADALADAAAAVEAATDSKKKSTFRMHMHLHHRGDPDAEELRGQWSSAGSILSDEGVSSLPDDSSSTAAATAAAIAAQSRARDPDQQAIGSFLRTCESFRQQAMRITVSALTILSTSLEKLVRSHKSTRVHQAINSAYLRVQDDMMVIKATPPLSGWRFSVLPSLAGQLFVSAEEVLTRSRFAADVSWFDLVATHLVCCKGIVTLPGLVPDKPGGEHAEERIARYLERAFQFVLFQETIRSKPSWQERTNTVSSITSSKRGRNDLAPGASDVSPSPRSLRHSHHQDQQRRPFEYEDIKRTREEKAQPTDGTGAAPDVAPRRVATVPPESPFLNGTRLSPGTASQRKVLGTTDSTTHQYDDIRKFSQQVKQATAAAGVTGASGALGSHGNLSHAGSTASGAQGSLGPEQGSLHRYHTHQPRSHQGSHQHQHQHHRHHHSHHHTHHRHHTQHLPSSGSSNSSGGTGGSGGRHGRHTYDDLAQLNARVHSVQQQQRMSPSPSTARQPGDYDDLKLIKAQLELESLRHHKSQLEQQLRTQQGGQQGQQGQQGSHDYYHVPQQQQPYPFAHAHQPPHSPSMRASQQRSQPQTQMQMSPQQTHESQPDKYNTFPMKSPHRPSLQPTSSVKDAKGHAELQQACLEHHQELPPQPRSPNRTGYGYEDLTALNAQVQAALKQQQHQQQQQQLQQQQQQQQQPVVLISEHPSVSATATTSVV